MKKTITISLRNLQMHAYHGCLPQERMVGNDYLIDLELDLIDASSAIFNDQLEGTVNYAEVYETVRDEMNTTSNLLEHLCGRIAKALFMRFSNIKSIRIDIHKIAPPIIGCQSQAGVKIEFYREEFVIISK